jgi:hypothetical protein
VQEAEEAELGHAEVALPCCGRTPGTEGEPGAEVADSPGEGQDEEGGEGCGAREAGDGFFGPLGVEMESGGRHGLFGLGVF